MPEVAHQNENGKWYWWDESWTVEVGPFDTKELAQEACTRYAKEVLHHPEVVSPKTNQQPDVEVEAAVRSILTNKDVDNIMSKCRHYRKKIEKTCPDPVDWCHYTHNYCMVGNKAALPKERTAVADVCIRGY